MAAELGAWALRERAAGLNSALAQAAAFAEQQRATGAAGAARRPAAGHADRDRRADRGGAGAAGAALAPSRDGGTNGLYLYRRERCRSSSGPGSLARHVAAAHERGVALRLFRAPGLELDIDRPDDLLLLARAAGATAAQRVVRALSLCERMAVYKRTHERCCDCR